MHEARTARLQLLGAAALFSTGGAAIKACDLAGWQVAGLRSAVASLAFLALVPAARRLPSPREWLVGLGYAGTMVLFVLSNKLTSAANAIFLQSTAPIYILLFAPWLLRERIRARDLAFLGAVGLGLAAFFVEEGRATETATDPWLGNVLALCSGVGWALTVTGLRWLGARDEGSGSTGAVVAGNAIAFVVCLGPMLASDAPPSASPLASYAIVAYLGVFQIALAYLLITRGIRRVEAFEASVLLLIEPVLNPLWAYLVHGERPGAWALAGGAVILSATLAKTWLDARRTAAAARGDVAGA